MLCPSSYEPPLKRKSRWDVPPELPEVNAPKAALGLSSVALSILAAMKKTGSVAGHQDGEQSKTEDLTGLTSSEITDEKEQKPQDRMNHDRSKSNSNYLNVQNDYEATLYYPMPTIGASTNNNGVKPYKDCSNNGFLKRKYFSDAEIDEPSEIIQNGEKYMPKKLDPINELECSREEPSLPEDNSDGDSFDNKHNESFESQDQRLPSPNRSLDEQNGGLATFSRGYSSPTKPWVQIFDTEDEDVKIRLTISDDFEGSDKNFISINIAQELSSETIKMIARMRANSVSSTEDDDRNELYSVSKYKKRRIPRFKGTPFFLTFSLFSMFYDHKNYEKHQTLDLTYRINRRIPGIGYFVMTIDEVNYEEEWFVICELFRSLGYGPPPVGKPKVHVINILSRVILESSDKNDNNKTSINPWSRIGYSRKHFGTKNNISDLLQPRQELCNVCKFKHNDPEFKNQSTKNHFDAHVLESLAPFGLKKETTVRPPTWYPNDWMPKKKESFGKIEEQEENRKRNQEETSVSKNTDVVSTGSKKPKCPVCCEDFAEYYHHDDEVWKLKNSKAANEHIVHNHCYESFNEPLVIQID